MRKIAERNITQMELNRFLLKEMTTKEDLDKIMRILKIDGNVAWQIDFDKRVPYQILNLGNGLIGGTHWVAVDNVNKRYFDSFGLPPPPMIPRDYEWIPLQIQDINYGHCGQYATLFLWYSKKNEVDQFFNLFTTGSAS